MRYVPLAMLATLAACQQPASQPANATPAETGYIAKVLALPPGQLKGVLFRAIQNGGGEACQGADKIEALPNSKTGQPNWRVTCPDHSEWLVLLSDDGTALVTGARDVAHPGS